MSARAADLDRRVSILEDKFTYLDTHGTRGVGLVQTQMADVKADVAKLEANLESFERNTTRDFRLLKQSVDNRANGRWAVFAGYIAALIPVYILLFITVGHR